MQSLQSPNQLDLLKSTESLVLYRGDRRRRRAPRSIKPWHPGINSPSDKQSGRLLTSDVVDGEVVLAKLLVFLECSDSHYMRQKAGIVLQYVLQNSS